MKANKPNHCIPRVNVPETPGVAAPINTFPNVPDTGGASDTGVSKGAFTCEITTVSTYGEASTTGDAHGACIEGGCVSADVK